MQKPNRALYTTVDLMLQYIVSFDLRDQYLEPQ